ncbi:MAG TPA: PepSY-associated TM helix domain-containing protein [Kofleriaceae bacterium]|nr:PepSY-associated TM helix domain-containing protein [Kofleriaceae bacterium]
MPEVADAVVDRTPRTRSQGPGATIKKRWRAWLRAVHRDIGYLAVGFTVIYALSGIAMNHIDDWDPNFHATEVTRTITPIPDEMSDADAAKQIAAAAGLTGKIDDVYRAGDEVRLSFSGGAKATAIGDTLTVQTRRDRMFFRVADWLHATRGKQAWKYIADAYAALLLYLAVSGIFMIKGRLGLRWRGATLIAVGLAAPIGYIVLSGGPGAQNTERVAQKPGEVDPPKPASPGSDGNSGIRPLPPDDPPPK